VALDTTGYPSSPFAIPGSRLTLPPRHRFPRHSHAGWSVALVNRGAGYIRFRGEVEEAGPGAITVLHPDEPHDGWVDREAGLDYLVTTLSESAAASYHGSSGMPLFTSHVIDDPNCARMLQRAHQTLSRSAADTDRLEAHELLTIALERLFQRHASVGPGGSDNSSAALRRVRSHIDHHYAQQLTLPELAAAGQMSPATLVRRFRTEVGMPPHEYLISRRVDAARILLPQGLPIAQVAVLVGFADQSHLTRHFTRIVGVPPGRSRRR
jgi:AraC-like DNA-binding protein